MSRAGAVRLRPVDPSGIGAALAEALAGGPPIAPLPPGRQEREQALAMLRLDEPVSEPDAAVVVSTSGSTGRPKGVVLSRRAMSASAAATSRRLGGPGDWVLALPGHYVAGLMVCARAQLGGTTVVAARSDLADLAAVADSLGERRYLSIVSTQLARALIEPDISAALTAFAAVLVGGGNLDPGLLEEAAARGVAVVTTYGMSETCGGCVYDGRPLAGVEVELDADDRIRLSGHSLFSGYRLRPDLTAEALADSRLRTRDRGRWVDGRLQVLGRLDDVVISGGLNVDLAEVEQRARRWPGLHGAELAVLGVRDPEWGTKVIAVTEVSPGCARGGLGDLRTFLSAFLPAYAAPRDLVHVESLPRTSSGKIDRPALRSRLQKGQP